MAAAVQVPLTFEIYKGDTVARTETLTQNIIKIGKLSSSQIRIDDETVSRMHAVIEVAGAGEVFIIDVGSAKGTYVNGQKINKTKLNSGDTVLLGSVKIVVTIGEAVAGASAPAPSPMDDGPTQVNTPLPAAARAATPPAARNTMMGMSAVPKDVADMLASEPSAAAPAPAPAPVAAPPVAVAAPVAPTPAAPSPVAAAVPPPIAGPIPPPMAHAVAPQHARPAAGAAPAAAAQGVFGGQATAFAGAIDVSNVELTDGSRAIEVAAMFEDAVIDVHHLSNPKAGVVTGATKGIIGGSVAGLLLAFIMFFMAKVEVSTYKHAKEQWEKDNPGKSVQEFVAANSKPSNPFYDIFLLTLFIGGLGGTAYGFNRLTEERGMRDFTIGNDRNVTFALPDELSPGASFPLVRSTGTDYELTFSASMKGDVTVDGKTFPLADLAQTGRVHASAGASGAQAWNIPAGARAKIEIGNNTFLVSSVAQPRKHPVPFNVNWAEHVYTMATAGVMGLFLLISFLYPPDMKGLSLDNLLNDQRFAQFLTKPPEEKEEQIPEWLKKKSDDEAGGKGKRHKGDEGKMGKQTSKNKAGLYGLKGPPDNKDPHLAKMLAEEAAQKAGVLGLLKSQEGSHLASIFGRDSALGTDADNVMGGLVGTQIGEAYGQGGLGLVGSGKGGGGTGEGTIGLGNLGTIGKGGGGGSGSGYGRGAGGLGGRRAGAPDVVPGTAQVRGSLDKEIIRRIIRRHLNEVRFCYEKELLRKADLYGRVTIQFTISGTGQVVASIVQQSTMNAPAVEQCIADAVKRWEFPKPQGGGIVIVSYPFVLKAAGGGE